jgi:uncharacterized protein YjiS (DUF1127 family)
MTAIRFEGAGRSPFAGRRNHPVLHRAKNPVARLVTGFHDWRRRARDRARLAALDDRMLADIGISRAEAQFLSDKPFWKE